MARIARQRQWFEQPHGAVAVDWTNPLTRGLVGAFIPGINVNLCDGVPLRKWGTPSLGARPGVGHVFTAGGVEYPEPPNSSSPYAKFDLTVGTALTVAAQTSATNSEYGFFRANGSSVPGWGVGLHGGTFNGAYARWGSYSYSPSSGASGLTLSPRVVAVSGDGITACAYLDGVLVGSGPYTAPSYQYSSGRAAMLSAASATSAAQKIRPGMGLFWNRALSAEEVSRISSNPWQVFEPRRISSQRGAPQVVGASANTVALAGASAGSVPVGATSAQTVSLTGSGTAALSLLAASSSTLTVSGAGQGSEVIDGDAVATILLTGSATAALPLSAVGTSTTVTVLGSSAGLVPITGAARPAVIDLIWAGIASAPVGVASVGNFNTLGAAEAQVGEGAASSGPIDLTGSAGAQIRIDAASAGVLALAGVSEAEVVSSGGASPSQVWNYVLPNGLTARQTLLDLATLSDELYRLHGLEPGVPLVVTSASRVAGAIRQAVSALAGATTVTRQ